MNSQSDKSLSGKGLSNKGKHNVGADWQKNWGSSIAIKVTAPVLWTLIFFGLLVAILVQHNQSAELQNQFSREADQLAYIATRYISEHPGIQDDGLSRTLANAMQEMQFTHGEIQIDTQHINFGQSQDQQTPIKITRQLLYADAVDPQRVRIAHMTLFHPPLNIIIKQQRKSFLIRIGIPFFIFGLLLAWLIHIIVTKPIFELVNATKAVSEGDITLRIKTHRTDEFGHLSEFFNEMLDNLQAKQEELSKAVIEAESANRMKSSFLANMSHEIRTPLTAIIGYSDLLKNDDQSEEDRGNQIDSIQRAGHHLLEIISDILDLSKIEAGELLIETLWVSPMEIVKEVEGLVSLRAEAKGLKFSVKYEYPLPDVINTDPTRLRQILLNLCTNAVKFTSDGSVSVRVGYLPEERLMKFEVTDSGIGIAESELQRLFRPFSQADTSTTRQYGGTGLGLAISKQLAERLGGDIRCISHKGIGSKFILTVATGEIVTEGLIQEAPQPQTRPEKSISAAMKHNLRGRVLLAEDTPDNQMLIAMYIRRTGAEVAVVENGKLACDRALAEDFDLILMDMQMPVMDGVSATRRLRDAGYDKPIVALTANALQQDRDKCEAAGTDDYLTKPLDLASFYAVLNRYLKQANLVDNSVGTPSDASAYQHPPLATASANDVTAGYSAELGVDEAMDHEYQALVDRFVSRLPSIIGEIKVCLAEKNWTELQSIAHQLKGLGASFGFEEMSLVAAQVQALLDNDQLDQKAIENQTSRLLDVCESALDENKRSYSSAG